MSKLRIILLLSFFIVNPASAQDIPWSSMSLKKLTVDAFAATITPDSQYLLLDNAQKIQFYNLEKGEIEHTKSISKEKTDGRCCTRFLSLNKDASLMASYGNIGLELWNFPGLTLFRSWRIYDEAYPATFSPDGKFMAVSDFENGNNGDPKNAIILDLHSGKKIKLPTMGDYPVGTLSFNPESTLLAISSYKKVDIWSVKGWKKTLTLKARSGIFSPNGRYLACQVNENEKSGINIWDLKMQRWLWRKPAHEFVPSTDGTAFSPDSKYVVSTGTNRTSVSNIETRKKVFNFPVKDASAAQFSPDGRWLILIGYDEIREKDAALKDTKTRSRVYIYSSADGSKIFKQED